MKKELIKFKEIWDKPSNKGFPTKDSIVITIALTKHNNSGLYTAGYAIKLPDDQPIPRIGRAIARKSKYSMLFDVDIVTPESYVLDYLELVGKRYPSRIMNRIKLMIGFNEASMKSYTYLCPATKNTLNTIED